MICAETQISFAHVGFAYCSMEMIGSQKSLFRYKFRYGATTSGSHVLYGFVCVQVLQLKHFYEVIISIVLLPQIHPVGKLRLIREFTRSRAEVVTPKISENCSNQSNATNKKPIFIVGLLLYDLYVQCVCPSPRSLHMNNMYNISARPT
jgi:hypothetical protein